MLLRCLIDGLVLPANWSEGDGPLLATDGNETFALEALEAQFYEVIAATESEWLRVERWSYRLLRKASDFEWQPDDTR